MSLSGSAPGSRRGGAQHRSVRRRVGHQGLLTRRHRGEEDFTVTTRPRCSTPSAHHRIITRRHGDRRISLFVARWDHHDHVDLGARGTGEMGCCGSRRDERVCSAVPAGAGVLAMTAAWPASRSASECRCWRGRSCRVPWRRRSGSRRRLVMSFVVGSRPRDPRGTRALDPWTRCARVMARNYR